MSSIFQAHLLLGARSHFKCSVTGRVEPTQEFIQPFRGLQRRNDWKQLSTGGTQIRTCFILLPLFLLLFYFIQEAQGWCDGYSLNSRRNGGFYHHLASIWNTHWKFIINWCSVVSVPPSPCSEKVTTHSSIIRFLTLTFRVSPPLHHVFSFPSGIQVEKTGL